MTAKEARQYLSWEERATLGDRATASLEDWDKHAQDAALFLEDLFSEDLGKACRFVLNGISGGGRQRLAVIFEKTCVLAVELDDVDDMARIFEETLAFSKGA